MVIYIRTIDIFIWKMGENNMEGNRYSFIEITIWWYQMFESWNDNEIQIQNIIVKFFVVLLMITDLLLSSLSHSFLESYIFPHCYFSFGMNQTKLKLKKQFILKNHTYGYFTFFWQHILIFPPTSSIKCFD